MISRIVMVILFTFLIASCSSTSGRPNNNQSVIIGEVQIGWNDILTSGSPLRQAFTTEEGTSIFLFSRQNLNDAYQEPQVILSSGQTVQGSVGACDLLRIDPKPNTEQLWSECREKFSQLPPRQTAPRVQFDEFLSLAEQAVTIEGSCQWLGYDRTLDMRVRSFGSLASTSDERLFFSKLRCN